MKTPLLFLCLLCVFCGYAQAAQDRPNIVLILSDDQSWTDYSFMGHQQIETPRIDRLAKESAAFAQAYVPTALCRPSLMTLATGLYAHQHRTSGNDPADTEANAAHAKAAGEDPRELLISHVDELPTVAKLLGEAGYLSHQSGKWWEGPYQRGGFTHGMTRGFPKPRGRHGDDGLKIGREGMDPVFDFIDEAVEAEKPFFLWYAAFMPHTPHTPPARLFKKYKAEGLTDSVAKYYAMCEWYDETCGQLVDRLEEKGIRDNTLIVYVCDNGWVQLEDRNGYAAHSKRSPYEKGTRTPILFSWPGVIDEANRPELCTSIDIVPTMLAAAGVDIPKSLPGLNLLPALKSGKAIRRNTIFGESFAHDIANIHKPEDSLLYRWVIDGDWKLLLTYDGRQGRMKYPPNETGPRLFNVKADPYEQNDVAAANPERVKKLAKKIAKWWPVTERMIIGM